jgi:hypothetical protein
LRITILLPYSLASKSNQVRPTDIAHIILALVYGESVVGHGFRQVIRSAIATETCAYTRIKVALRNRNSTPTKLIDETRVE